jgi:hypothetical protein
MGRLAKVCFALLIFKYIKIFLQIKRKNYCIYSLVTNSSGIVMLLFCVKDRSDILFRLLEGVGGQIRADEKDTADSLTLLPAQSGWVFMDFGNKDTP